MKRVYISSMGIVSGLGNNLTEFTESLRETKQNFLIGDIQIERRQTLSTQTAILCVKEALNNINYDPNKTALVIGGQNINQRYCYEQFKLFENNPEYLLPSYAVQFMDSDLVGILSELFNIHAEGYSVGGASASGNMAIIHGFRLIKSGLVETCVVVGALADFSPLEFRAFQLYGALSPDNHCRPFDKTHNGFVYGQASACVVLSSQKGIAEILGTGIYLDGNRLAEPNAEGEAIAMNKALHEAHKKPEDIQYLNPHGTGSALGDETEITAIKKIFGNHSPWINTTKSLTGHCLWSAGVVEAIATVVQLQNNFLHGNPVLDNPINISLNFVNKKSISQKTNIAMSNSYGIGGINTSIILGV